VARSSASTGQQSPGQGSPGRATGERASWAHRLAGLPSGRRTKWAVLAFWVIVIVLTGSLAGKLMGAEKNDASAYLPASAESTQALKLQDQFIYVRSSGLTPADLAKAARDARQFAALPGAGQVLGPVPSHDHKAAEILINAHLGFSSSITSFVNRVHTIASAGDPGLTAYVTGPAASAADSVKIFKGIDSTLLYATLGVVIVLLLLTYRSPILWLLPIISAGVALIASEAFIYLLIEHAGLVVNGQSAGILVVLVLGASTDYALLLIARYREELRRHEDRHEAMAAGDHRALDVLAVPAPVRVGRPYLAGRVGPGRPGHRPPPPGHLDQHRGAPRGRLARPAWLPLRRADPGRVLPRHAQRRGGRQGAGRALPGGRGRAGHGHRQRAGGRPAAHRAGQHQGDRRGVTAAGARPPGAAAGHAGRAAGLPRRV
jgi:hypothetical protein